MDASQLRAATNWVKTVRKHNENGALVVLFIHGWHHGAQWESPTKGDSHFQSFRMMLASLALRESERYWGEKANGRRVVGVYVGWNGDPKDSRLKNIPLLKNASFYNRYAVAKQIGESANLQHAIHELILCTKADLAASSHGQLILLGHSMGGLILESAIHALLISPSGKLLQPKAQQANSLVSITIQGQEVIFPDAVISLNSAGDSRVAHSIKNILFDKKVSKEVTGSQVQYNPPLLIAITSRDDNITGSVWSGAKLWNGETTGHDETLFTHNMHSGEILTNSPSGSRDRGQNFHCLRFPEPKVASTPTMIVDLPIREREGTQDFPEHQRYRLEPENNKNQEEIFWVFQVSGKLISDHNDIFNSRSGSLILSLIQMSGAVASLAKDWDDSFE